MISDPASCAVVYIITKLELGGAQKVCLELFKETARVGYNTILISGRNGTIINELDRYFVRHDQRSQLIMLDSFKHEVGWLQLWLELKNFINLVQILRTIKKSYVHVIVHTHSTKAGLIGRWAAWCARIPVRLHTIHGFGFHAYQNKLWRQLAYTLEWMTAPITTKFICVSQSDLKQGTQLLPGFAAKAQIIRAGVETGLFQAPPTANATTPAILSAPVITTFKPATTIKTFIFGSVACFKPQKNLFDLLQAFQWVTQQNAAVNYYLELVGDGSLRPVITRWLQRHKLKKEVILHGWQAPEKLPGIMQKWDCFVLSSLWEGLPCAVVEARLLKLPVLSYDTGGINEVVIPDRNGWLFKQGDWHNLAQGMLKLSQSTALQLNFRQYSDDLTEFSNSAMVARHLQLYEYLLK